MVLNDKMPAACASASRIITPGDQLILEVKMGRQVRGIGKFEARARVGDTTVTEAELMCTIKEQ